jgi:predicted Zn-dependent protease
MSEREAIDAAPLSVVWALIERRRFDQARAVVGNGLREDPDDVDLLHAAATIEWLDDQHDAARRLVREVLSRDPEHALARELLIEIDIADGDLVRAELGLLELLRESPRDAGLIADYALLLLRAGVIDKARAVTAEALRVAPELPRALLASVVLDLIDGVTPERSSALRELLSRHPDQAHSAHALLAALGSHGRVAEAHALARELYRADPRSGAALEVVRELAYQNHWTMKPLWPVIRYGWTGAIGLYIVVVGILRIGGEHLPAGASMTLTVAWLGYVVYSWIWPPLLRRWVLRA